MLKRSRMASRFDVCSLGSLPSALSVEVASLSAGAVSDGPLAVRAGGGMVGRVSDAGPRWSPLSPGAEASREEGSGAVRSLAGGGSVNVDRSTWIAWDFSWHHGAGDIHSPATVGRFIVAACREPRIGQSSPDSLLRQI